ncbi:hypothetical protein ZWY2020_037722 [Hordeum vulgare]|nr:hypothetical protein ZWY2020_037722 [Hordeum vulgare]
MDYATFYLVKLTGISVGGSSSASHGRCSRGLIVDCGNIISHLPSTPYEKLQSAFRAAMAAYRSSRATRATHATTSPDSATSPCPGRSHLHRRVTVDLDVPNGLLLDGCLAFTESGPDDYVGFLGNVQMRTLEMLYDVKGARLGFRAAGC